MLNIIQLQDRLQNAPDDWLLGQMQTPDGDVPQYLVLTEMKRRKGIRDSGQAAPPPPTSTIADELSQEFSPNVNEQSPDFTRMPQENMPLPTQPPADYTSSPQGFAAGGIVGNQQMGSRSTFANQQMGSRSTFANQNGPQMPAVNMPASTPAAPSTGQLPTQASPVAQQAVAGSPPGAQPSPATPAMPLQATPPAPQAFGNPQAQSMPPQAFGNPAMPSAPMLPQQASPTASPTTSWRPSQPAMPQMGGPRAGIYGQTFADGGLISLNDKFSQRLSEMFGGAPEQAMQGGFGSNLIAQLAGRAPKSANALTNNQSGMAPNAPQMQVLQPGKVEFAEGGMVENKNPLSMESRFGNAYNESQSQSGYNAGGIFGGLRGGYQRHLDAGGKGGKLAGNTIPVSEQNTSGIEVAQPTRYTPKPQTTERFVPDRWSPMSVTAGNAASGANRVNVSIPKLGGPQTMASGGIVRMADGGTYPTASPTESEWARRLREQEAVRRERYLVEREALWGGPDMKGYPPEATESEWARRLREMEAARREGLTPSGTGNAVRREELSGPRPDRSLVQRGALYGLAPEVDETVGAYQGNPGPVADQAIMRELRRRALRGDQAAQARLDELLEPRVNSLPEQNQIQQLWGDTVEAGSWLLGDPVEAGRKLVRGEGPVPDMLSGVLRNSRANRPSDQELGLRPPRNDGSDITSRNPDYPVPELEDTAPYQSDGSTVEQRNPDYPVGMAAAVGGKPPAPVGGKPPAPVVGRQPVPGGPTGSPIPPGIAAPSTQQPDPYGKFAEKLAAMEAQAGKDRNYDRWMAAAQMGLGMMNNTSPNFLSAVSQGTQTGMPLMIQAEKDYRDRQFKTMGIDFGITKARSELANGNMDRAIKAYTHSIDTKQRERQLNIQEKLANKEPTEIQIAKLLSDENTPQETKDALIAVISTKRGGAANKEQVTIFNNLLRNVTSQIKALDALGQMAKDPTKQTKEYKDLIKKQKQYEGALRQLAGISTPAEPQPGPRPSERLSGSK